MAIPIALTIAGSDSGGGAGIQADLKSFSALGVYGTTVITALTAQNTVGVSAIQQVPADFVTAQIDAVFGDLNVAAVKIGMVSQREVIEAIASGLDRWRAKNVVLDPVMVATSGDRLIDDDCIATLKAALVPKAAIITPNLPEAAALLDEPVAADKDFIEKSGQAAIGAGLRRGADQGRPRLGRDQHRLPVRPGRGGEARSAAHLTRNTHGKPAVRCRRRSPPALPKARAWRLPSATPRFGSAPPSPPPTGCKSATGHGPIDHFHGFY